jgi:GNAT superfamily N-acetyltransferase
MSADNVRIRTATAADAPTVHRLIRELAVYERLEHEAVGGAEDLVAHLEGDPPLVEALLAEDGDGTALGFALTYTTFSTFQCLPGMYIEDLFVVPAARGRGVGGALLRAIAAHAVERGHGRLEWSVLDWNEPAIGFYRRIGGLPVDGWTRYRLTGDSLAAAARRPVGDAAR